MNWSEQAWQSIAPIYESIETMPFVEELANGSLSMHKFQFYMAQDSLYLEHFGRSLALIGARSYDVADALTYIRFAENVIVVENALHESYFADFGIVGKSTIQPACHHYIHFLRSVSAIDAVEVAMAATLPCFWIYKKVGDHILKHHKSAHNPYQRWIETYAGEDFNLAVHQAIDSCNKAAQHTTPAIRDKMTEAFITASRMEYNFWDAAYTLQEWN